MKRWLGIFSMVVTCACGGGGGGGYVPPPAPPPSSSITVSISPASQTKIDAGQILKFTATVTNDSSAQGVKWSVSVAGLSGDAAGTLTATTTSSATYNAPASVSSSITATVTATSIADSTKTSSASVAVYPPPSITSTTLSDASLNASYSATLHATGGAGALAWSLASGSLPAGLSLSSAGSITGTPTAAGDFTFTVQVADSSGALGGPATARAQIHLSVITGLDITTTSLPQASVGVVYNAGLDASGGVPPYTWRVSGGALPGGLTLQASSGNISGTPTASGTFNFTVAVQDSSPSPLTQSKSLSIVVTSSAQQVTIATTTLTDASPNTEYSATLHASGGVGALTWTLVGGALPAGLSLSGSGVISGDPTVPGVAAFTVQVTDSASGPGGPNTAQARLSLTVVTELSIDTASLPAGSLGGSYLAQIDASGGTPPYTWRLTSGSLPSGLTLLGGSGVISGSPGSQGNFTFTVSAQDSSPAPQTQIRTFGISVGAPQPLAITTSSLLDGTLNAPYQSRVAVQGGTPPYAWSVAAGTLPPGMTINPSTGSISGTPPSTGTAYFTVQVQDSSPAHQTATQALSITIVDVPAPCASSGNNAALNGSYAFSLSGFNDGGFLTVVGSFTADGSGGITAGEADTNGVLGVQHGNFVTSASSYAVGPDGRGCATLATPFGTFITRFTVGVGGSNPAAGGRMIEWDCPSASAFIAAGKLLRQSSLPPGSTLAGSYVYQTVGWDSSPQGGREACVGVLSASGNTFSALEQDCNDAWTITNSGAPSTAGAYTGLDSNGRGTGIIALGEINANLAFYAVSSSQLLVVTADPIPALSGEWDLQTPPAGGSSFTQSSLNGKMAFYLSGLTLNGTATTVSMEAASADGSSSMTIEFMEDRAGTLQAASALNCAYSVEANGRVTLSSDSGSCGGNLPVFYLAAPNTGFLVDTAPGVDTGSLEPQSNGPFNNASLSGTFFGGMEAVVLQAEQAEVDPVDPNGSGRISGTTDMSSMCAQDVGASFLAATYAVNSDGTFTVSSSGGNVAGMIISPTKFVMFSPSTLATPMPTLLVMQK